MPSNYSTNYEAVLPPNWIDKITENRSVIVHSLTCEFCGISLLSDKANGGWLYRFIRINPRPMVAFNRLLFCWHCQRQVHRRERNFKNIWMLGWPIDRYVRFKLRGFDKEEGLDDQKILKELIALHKEPKNRKPAQRVKVIKRKKTRKYANRFQIFKRDRYRCQICGVSAQYGEDVRLEIDHIQPRSQGGGNNPDNLWVLCFACNRGKGASQL